MSVFASLISILSALGACHMIIIGGLVDESNDSALINPIWGGVFYVRWLGVVQNYPKS